MFSWFTTDLTERHRGQDEKLNSSIRSILLGFSSQFTDYFAKRITKFLKPRYLLSLVFKIWKQTRSCRKQVVTSVQAWRNSPTWPVLPLSSGSEALPQGENLQRSEFNRSKCFHQPLPSGSLVRLRCWRPAPPVPQEYFRLKKPSAICESKDRGVIISNLPQRHFHDQGPWEHAAAGRMGGRKPNGSSW